MRTILRVSALFLAIGVTVFWLFGGPSPHFWTETSVLHVEKDPVTDLEKRTYEDRFVPGMDFLGTGLIAAALIAGVSFFFAKKAETAPADSTGNPS